MGRPCVLIIDDSKFVRTTFRRILQPEFDVREETDGEAGWRAVEADPSVALVLCDISMPRLDGFGVLGRIRGAKDERIRHLPVIIISGDEDESTRKRARDSGANDFISKMADSTEVLSRMDNLLRLVRAKADASESRTAAVQSATHDPLTGTFTLHYLLTEGRKHYAHALRHGQSLSVVSFRIDGLREVVGLGGKEAGEQLLARIAKAVLKVLRAEDSMGRAAADSFTVIMAGTTAEQARTFARRLYEQLGGAQIKASIGIASLGTDAAASVEELMRLASTRMAQTGPRPAAQTGPAPAPALPPEIERALNVLERMPAGGASGVATEVMRRMLAAVSAMRNRPK
jgi:diguanylate cyclase (GGDEF)-like protein